MELEIRDKGGSHPYSLPITTGVGVGGSCNVYIPNMPKECDIVILCVNEGCGLKPVGLSMPHQITVEKLQKIYREVDTSSAYFSFVIIPAKSKDYISIGQRR